MAETSLHRELKAFYAGDGNIARREVRWGGYRIDVVTADELVEIQHGSLAAIRGKIARLLERHRVRVVKPIVVEKRLIKRQRAGATVVQTRRSPKRGKLLDLFDELVYFTRVFPHESLTLEVVLVDIEERRYPGRGKRRRRRREGQDFQVQDQLLVRIVESRSFATLLQQSEELGSSMTDALRVYSDDMRHKRLSRAEEKAYSLPAKLSVPLVLCVFPVLVIVIMLPVFVRLKTGV